MPSPETARRFRGAFVLLLALAVTAAFLLTIQGFLMALLMAAVLTGLCRPVHRRLLRLLRGRESLSAVLTVLGLTVLLVVPATLFGGLVTAQALEISQRAQPWVSRHVSAAQDGEDLVPVPAFLEPYEQQIMGKVGELAGSLGGYLVNVLADATRGTVTFFFMFFVTLYALFFFLRDGRQTLDRILYVIPLGPEEEERLVERFVSVSRATVKGTLVIGIVQGALAGGAFAVVGIQGAAFWGTVMAFLSIIPGLGTALIWVPAVIYLLTVGSVAAGIGLAAWCAAVVGTADNVLRPILVGRDTEMPDLLILVSTLGGLLLFGAVGILLGPVVAALFITVWDIYAVTFSDFLPRVGPEEVEGA
jgi:predicted PurR-regulated permease PerM